MPQRDGAAVRVHMVGCLGQTELTEDGNALAGEGLVEFDDVDVADRQAGLDQQALHGGGGADAHDAWRHAGGGHRNDTGARRQAVAPGTFLGRHDQRGGAIVDAGCVAGGDGAGIAERGLQLRQHFQRGVGAQVFIVFDHRVALAALDGDGRDLLGEEPAVLRFFRSLLAGVGELVLVGAGDLEFLRHILTGFRHGVRAVRLLHQLVNEAPADGGVVHLGRPRKRLCRLAHHEGRPAHAFDAAGQH